MSYHHGNYDLAWSRAQDQLDGDGDRSAGSIGASCDWPGTAPTYVKANAALRGPRAGVDRSPSELSRANAAALSPRIDGTYSEVPPLSELQNEFRRPSGVSDAFAARHPSEPAASPPRKPLALPFDWDCDQYWTEDNSNPQYNICETCAFNRGVYCDEQKNACRKACSDMTGGAWIPGTVPLEPNMLWAECVGATAPPWNVSGMVGCSGQYEQCLQLSCAGPAVSDCDLDCYRTATTAAESCGDDPACREGIDEWLFWCRDGCASLTDDEKCDACIANCDWGYSAFLKFCISSPYSDLEECIFDAWWNRGLCTQKCADKGCDIGPPPQRREPPSACDKCRSDANKSLADCRTDCDTKYPYWKYSDPLYRYWLSVNHAACFDDCRFGAFIDHLVCDIGCPASDDECWKGKDFSDCWGIKNGTKCRVCCGAKCAFYCYGDADARDRCWEWCTLISDCKEEECNLPACGQEQDVSECAWCCIWPTVAGSPERQTCCSSCCKLVDDLPLWQLCVFTISDPPPP